MKTLNSPDQIWEAEINFIVHQTNLEELKSWVMDGKLNPTHRVRMKNLNWMEAQRIPVFNKLFEAKGHKLLINLSQPANTTSHAADNSNPVSTAPPAEKPYTTPITAPTFEKKETTFNPISAGTQSNVTVSPEYIERNDEIKPFSFVKPIEVSPVPDTIEIETPAVLKPPARRMQSDNTRPAAESAVLCLTCLYFCGSIPLAATRSSFLCPVCFSECEIIERSNPTSGKPPVRAARKGKIPFPDLENNQFKLRKKYTALRFILGCLVIAVLAAGGSYLWVYQLRTPIENDEKTNQELVVLQEKFTTDKIQVSIRFAAREELPKTDNQGNAGPNADMSLELANLQKQYKEDRQTIIDTYQNKKAHQDFEQLALIGFFSLLVLYILKRLLLN